MDTDIEVLIAGAGPTGLLLANELGLAGVRAAVAERLPHRTGHSKALNLQPRTAEVLDCRGWLAPVLDRSLTLLPAGHFAGLPLDYSALDTAFPHQVGIPQARVEEFLEDHLAQYGVPVLRGRELTSLRQDADGVTATLRGADGTESTCRARYLVGADGGRSTVRHLLGTPFPGRDGRIGMAVADIELAPVDGGSDSPGEPWQLPDLTPDPAGVAFLLPLGDGVHRLILGGPEQQGVDRDAPVTDDEVRAALARCPGPPRALRAVRWASRFTDASRQAERYAEGRVLLAGDAAHIHAPAGGQGLNLGMQDAFNLGWKLAATLRGRAPDGLLATYHAERHPVGARVLANTQAQMVLTLPDPDAMVVRELLTDLLTVPEANRRVAAMIAGTDIRYPMPGAPDHPLLGARAPGVRLPGGRGALLADAASAVTAAASAWADRVDRLDRGPLADEGEALLVRPDGYVCWAGPDDDTHELRSALTRWFGPADEFR
ncbi:FAD-dependent monooxygenase [Streptomyces murinus]|uniref:FAD-dependent monooxygenase n=1 Tax=Streptomyces murinus TaxID=33900 RepID=UPI000A1F11F8|nr:FAD-dependent monooxygenase [Streptomyces murinus]WDO08223.1 FAD-dependent monooxygenase [Streptomyces murinus]